MKRFGQAALAIVAALLVLGVLFLVTGFLLPLLFASMAEVPWVATGVLFLGFLIGLVIIPRRGWSGEGTLLLIGVVLLGAILDGVGNPVFNAPYEALFLEPDQRLQGSAIVDRFGGETHISREMSIVDSDGRFVATPNWFLLALYRALNYFVLYSVLLTISGLLPDRRSGAKTGSGARPTGRRRLGAGLIRRR